MSWRQVADELDRGTDVTFLDHPYANTFKALQVATAALESGLAFAYTSLAVYPPDIRIPVAAVVRYWGHVRGSSSDQAHTDLRMLADRQLLILDQGEIAFHDLQHSYLLLQADNLVLLHADLLAAYETLLPAADLEWWRLPPDEPYIWDHLLHHLHGAGDRIGAVSTLTDLAYLAMRISTDRPTRRQKPTSLMAKHTPRRPADRLAAALAGTARSRIHGIDPTRPIPRLP
jgi:hypothetical protein